MKIFRSRMICILLAVAMLVTAIAGVSDSVFPTADAATFFTPASGSFYEAKGTTLEQGTEVWKLAAAQTQPDVAEKLYNVLFNAQYRVTDFGGSMWCNSNKDSYITKVTDSVLGTVSWNWSCKGCFSYAMFVSQYTRNSNGRDNIYKLSQNSATDLKNFLASYADPGEHLHFYYSGSSYGEHSVVYLAGTEDGFYYLSENGDSLDIRLYYSSYTYFASILKKYSNEYMRVYSTNTGKDTPTDPGSIVVPSNPSGPSDSSDYSKISQVIFNGHTYTFYTGAKDYAEAAAYAQKSGGYLATITSAEEQAAVNTLLARAPVPFAWIGLTAKNGEYAWVTDEKLLYRNNYDDNTTGSNGFVFTDRLSSGTLNGKWDTCGTSYTIGGATYNADSFGFIAEVGEPFPTQVVKVSEVLVGLDQYTVFDAGLTYAEAQEFCKSQGGHLVTIGSADELATILNMQKSANTDYILGATMQANKQWAWIDGTPVMADIPLPETTRGNHLTITTGADGTANWSVVDDKELGGFICEVNLKQCYIGDVDMDGAITAGDAREALRYSVGLTNNPNVAMLGNVDMTDMNVNAGDARILLRASVDLEDWHSWEKILIIPESY